MIVLGGEDADGSAGVHTDAGEHTDAVEKTNEKATSADANATSAGNGREKDVANARKGECSENLGTNSNENSMDMETKVV